MLHHNYHYTRPVARDFERGVLFDQKWTFTCMMINKGTDLGGSGGMPPQKIFENWSLEIETGGIF